MESVFVMVVGIVEEGVADIAVVLRVLSVVLSVLVAVVRQYQTYRENQMIYNASTKSISRSWSMVFEFWSGSWNRAHPWSRSWVWSWHDSYSWSTVLYLSNQ
jgi:hypothetical protein